MKIQRRHKETAEVSTESLNDIMFFLLLFFLIISTLANPNVIKLTLPSSTSAQQMQKQQVALEVSADHQFMIVAGEYKKAIPFSDLESVLKIVLETTQSPTVVLRFDNSLTVQDLADVMQIGYNLGVKMVLATKATSK